MSFSGVRDVCALHKNPLLGQRSIGECLSGSKRFNVFCCSIENELGQRAKHNRPRAALRRFAGRESLE
jgi:hypothetical protein